MASPSPSRARRRARRLTAVLAAALLAPLAGGLLWFGTHTVSGFDPTVWRTQAGVRIDNLRSGMISDLQAGKLRVGMTREEVHALLGPPELPEPGQDGWGLGLAPFGADFEYYVIRYGPDGRVVGFGLVRG